MSGEGPYAPGALELVRGFVNSRDVEADSDHLANPESWAGWAASQEILGSARAADLARLRDLREQLRAALLANHDRAPLPTETVTALQSALTWSGAEPIITERGLGLGGPTSGPRGLARQVVEAVASAMSDGTWSRLKACRNDTCHWAFYDHSRSRTGQWCSMRVCGNRNKQARWRSRAG